MKAPNPNCRAVNDAEFVAISGMLGNAIAALDSANLQIAAAHVELALLRVKEEQERRQRDEFSAIPPFG